MASNRDDDSAADTNKPLLWMAHPVNQLEVNTLLQSEAYHQRGKSNNPSTQTDASSTEVRSIKHY